MMTLKVSETQTLLDAVAILAPDSSKTTLRSWIKEGRVFIDGTKVTLATTPVHKGQVVTLGERNRYTGGNIRILYEDRFLVVIDKPEGLLSVAAPFEKDETAHAILKAKYRPGRVFPVHRLDQETSGVMLFALSERARDALKSAFEQHAIKRNYIALVEGVVHPPQGTWSSYQFEDANYFVHNTTDAKKGKLAITHYETQGHSKTYSVLALHLETGRKNQIRAHCQLAGNPVAGDKKYGAQTDPAHRLCLHAHTLKFTHPVTGKEMDFESPIPDTFLKTIKKLCTTTHFS